eukprot:TRINITY_DN1572_c0_g1_i4.p1 TRINITY_DN1572_c0_g1~~TRINITY_DN1572_c0_g1_i4.p1  ORF type:complete len:800 (+),score=140.40 TRINITY_DN1572_c0_g1_i4:190-2589(+)
MASSSSEIGPPSLFHLSVDFICNGPQGPPDLAGLPETLNQLILTRLFDANKHAAALKLLHQPHLFTTLELPASVDVGDAWLRAIVQQDMVLEHLTIADCSNLTQDALKLLPRLTRLCHLHLCGLSCWSPVVAEAIACMPYLTYLHLEGQPGVIKLNQELCCCLRDKQCMGHLGLVGARGCWAGLCEQVGNSCPNLECMDMSESDIQDEGLAGWLTHLHQLKSITLKGCEALTDKCTRAIAALPDLSALNLARTGIGDVGMTVLQSLDKLQKLILCGTKVTDSSLSTINASMRTLTELDLSCKRVTDCGLQRLFNLSKLTTLNLSYTQVSDQGMKALRRLPKLSNLSLRWTRITDWAMGQLTHGTWSDPLHPEPSADPLSSTAPSLSLHRVQRTDPGPSDYLPLRRSRSSLDSISPSAVSRRLGVRSRAMSRSGDFSQVLRRCRATLDFTARAIDGDNDEQPGTPTSAMEDDTPTSLVAVHGSPEKTDTESCSAAHQEQLVQDAGPTQGLDLRTSESLMNVPSQTDSLATTTESLEQQLFLSQFDTDPDAEDCGWDGYPPSGWLDDAASSSGYDTIEPQVYRSMDLDHVDPDLEPNMNSFEPAPLQCVEWEPQLPQPHFLTVQPEPTNTTLCVALPTTTGFFGPAEPLAAAPAEDSQAQEEQDDEATLQEMRVLDLSVTDIADVGLSFLSAFSNITSLNLFSTKVTDDGLVHVAKLDNLVDLDLCGTEVSDTGLHRLQSLQLLETLKACGNVRITDEGAFSMLEAVEALQKLELRSTSVTTDCLNQIHIVLSSRSRNSMR